jgi:hypothetical protein
MQTNAAGRGAESLAACLRMRLQVRLAREGKENGRLASAQKRLRKIAADYADDESMRNNKEPEDIKAEARDLLAGITQ